MTVIYTGATFHTGSAPGVDAMAVESELITYLGGLDEARNRNPDADVVDLDGGHVLPGFVDAHTHLLSLGTVLRTVNLHGSGSLDTILTRLREGRDAAPRAARLQGHGWMFSELGDRRPHRRLLDEHFPDLPIYLTSFDGHSMWVNSTALAELDIDADTVAPDGGVIERDDDKSPTGLLHETAMQALARPRLVELTPREEFRADLRAACTAYVAAGVTSVVDMAFGENHLQVLGEAAAAGELPLRVDAHWLVPAWAEDPLAEVARAAEVAASDPAGVQVVGIKIMADGVIDACTASMRRPFADGSHPDPIWTADAMAPVFAAADRAGLAVAVHAIGDAAIDSALDAFETALGDRPHRCRHRIEHLEVADRAQLARLVRLGLTASMQPVHADPAIQDTWRANLGDDRITDGFPWRHAEQAGALLAFGTDAPTAPHPPLANMYVASTRCSAVDPERESNHPGLAVDRADAFRHASLDAAAAGSHVDRGALAVGKLADFVVVDANPFTVAPRALLDIGVLRTVIGGTTVYPPARDHE